MTEIDCPIRVSIVIVNWNAKKYLANCLTSILTLPCKYGLEIIVVDNASADGSKEMVKAQFPGVKLIENDQNVGFAKGNNIGIRQSTGQYVALVNTDVEMLDGCLDCLVEYIEKRRDIGILGPQILGARGDVQRSCMGNPTLWNILCRVVGLDTAFPRARMFGGYLMTYWQHNEIREVDVINGCFWLVRREAMTEVGLLDERFFMYAEDQDWCKRFNDAGWKVVYLPHPKAIHYGGGSSSNAPVRFYIEMNRASLAYWRKHHGQFAVVVYLLLIAMQHVLRLLGYALVYAVSSKRRADSLLRMQKSAACIQWMIGHEK